MPPRIAVLKKLFLHLNDNKDIILRQVKVIRKERYHVDLVGNPVEIALISQWQNDKLMIVAHNDALGIFGLVPDLPHWMRRLLS